MLLEGRKQAQTSVGELLRTETSSWRTRCTLARKQVTSRTSPARAEPALRRAILPVDAVQLVRGCPKRSRRVKAACFGRVRIPSRPRLKSPPPLQLGRPVLDGRRGSVGVRLTATSQSAAGPSVISSSRSASEASAIGSASAGFAAAAAASCAAFPPDMARSA